MRTNRVEEVFKNGLTHLVADAVFAWVFTTLPLLITAEVEHLRYVIQNQLANCLPVSASVRYRTCTSRGTCKALDAL